MMSLRRGRLFYFVGREETVREGGRWPLPFSRWGDAPQPESSFLIVLIDLCVKTLARVGRDYPWRRPERCPRCGGVRVWGHGSGEGERPGEDGGVFFSGMLPDALGFNRGGLPKAAFKLGEMRPSIFPGVQRRNLF